jgi:hypothetical protein
MLTSLGRVGVGSCVPSGDAGWLKEMRTPPIERVGDAVPTSPIKRVGDAPPISPIERVGDAAPSDMDYGTVQLYERATAFLLLEAMTIDCELGLARVVQRNPKIQLDRTSFKFQLKETRFFLANGVTVTLKVGGV